MALTVIAQHDTPVTSPTFSSTGELFSISATGEILRYSEGAPEAEWNYEAWGSSSGQPYGLAFDAHGVAFVCDAAHQAIFRITRTQGDDGMSRQEIEPYVREYESAALLGPNSLCKSATTGMLYFSDSGPFGETSISNPQGSVFAINSATQLLIPLCLNSLAHPCGVALSADEAVLYVAETCNNRILRFAQHPTGVFHCSVFHQLSGRFGPTALAVGPGGDLFVAHFDFADCTDNGRILVIDSEGEVSAIMQVPGPEITGLCVSPDEKYLIVAEASTSRLYRHEIR
mmetsp:Transcript_11210/g.26738  ORF Transcript_11210/g.26738 Transcript_11210/m.26738 type:complete len:286 (+) Transcript_11210:52-909(+)